MNFYNDRLFDKNQYCFDFITRRSLKLLEWFSARGLNTPPPPFRTKGLLQAPSSPLHC